MVGARLNRPPKTFPDYPSSVGMHTGLDESPAETWVRFVDCGCQHLVQERLGCAKGCYHLRRESFPLLVLQRPNEPSRRLGESPDTTGSMFDLLGCRKPAGRPSLGVAFANMGRTGRPEQSLERLQILGCLLALHSAQDEPSHICAQRRRLRCMRAGTESVSRDEHGHRPPNRSRSFAAHRALVGWRSCRTARVLPPGAWKRAERRVRS